MIPEASVLVWRTKAPWSDNRLVEQDLLLSRAVVEIFSEAVIREGLAFRGGTALHKLHLARAWRYSEDVDLVQIQPGPIGKIAGAIRDRLDPWLGSPRYTRNAGRVTLVYRFETEMPPVLPSRLKLEVNTREHFSVLGMRTIPFRVENPWFTGGAEVTTYPIEELLGTKLRALYQRKKGRDLFDLWAALEEGRSVPERIIACFRRYLEAAGQKISRAEFEANLAGKIGDPAFLADVRPLLAAGIAFDPVPAAARVRTALIARLPGEAWKGGKAGDPKGLAPGK
ncbi:MAG: nucleotidyl transferase AbiEii/AbiGii toxin family protein [Planctomycetota bacterium]